MHTDKSRPDLKRMHQGDVQHYFIPGQVQPITSRPNTAFLKWETLVMGQSALKPCLN